MSCTNKWKNLIVQKGMETLVYSPVMQAMNYKLKDLIMELV